MQYTYWIVIIGLCIGVSLCAGPVIKITNHATSTISVTVYMTEGKKRLSIKSEKTKEYDVDQNQVTSVHIANDGGKHNQQSVSADVIEQMSADDVGGVWEFAVYDDAISWKYSDASFVGDWDRYSW